jgi:hypothetical protein
MDRECVSGLNSQSNEENGLVDDTTLSHVHACEGRHEWMDELQSCKLHGEFMVSFS